MVRHSRLKLRCEVGTTLCRLEPCRSMRTRQRNASATSRVFRVALVTCVPLVLKFAVGPMPQSHSSSLSATDSHEVAYDANDRLQQSSSSQAGRYSQCDVPWSTTVETACARNRINQCPSRPSRARQLPFLLGLRFL